MKFPVPHDVKAKTIPGTEGWERMYPYQYQFVTDDPVRHAYEKESFWFYDGLHYPEPLYPFDTLWDEAWYLALSQFNNRIFVVPPVRGVDHRMINGYVYISPVPVKDGNEIGSRVPHFMERAGHYYKNWDALEAKWKVKMEATIRELEALQIPRLPDMEDMSVVTEALGESKGYHLLKSYDDLINLGIKCWQYHFEFLNLGYAAYVFFLDFAQKLFPNIPAQRVTQMISGIDVIMYEPDEQLKKLARRAIELGVDEILTFSPKWTEVEEALKKTPKGVEWLTSLSLAREPWFNISTGTGWFHYDRSWNDQMNVPLSGIATYIGKLKQGASIDRPTEADFGQGGTEPRSKNSVGRLKHRSRLGRSVEPSLAHPDELGTLAWAKNYLGGHGKTVSRRRTGGLRLRSLQLPEAAAPGQPAPEREEHDLVPLADSPPASEFVEAQGHRGAHGVAHAPDVEVKLVFGDIEPLAGRAQDASVGLVADEHVDFGGLHLGLVPFGEGKGLFAEKFAHPVDDAVEAKQGVVAVTAQFGEPRMIGRHGVKAVTMHDEVVTA